MQPPYTRKRYLVDRGYQLRFVTPLFMVLLAFAAASSVISSALLWKHVSSPEQSHASLILGLVALTTTLLIELLVAIPLVFVLGIRQSHRIVGPMNRIKQSLQAIGRGEFSQRITLRHGDALEDLAKSINQMAANLEQRFPRPPRHE